MGTRTKRTALDHFMRRHKLTSKDVGMLLDHEPSYIRAMRTGARPTKPEKLRILRKWAIDFATA